MNRIHYIDSFSRETTLAIQILVGIRSRAAINIETRFSRVDGCQPRAGRALHADADPGLQNAVSVNHRICLRIDDGLVERMRQSSNHAVRHTPRKLRMRIERDDKPNLRENR